MKNWHINYKVTERNLDNKVLDISVMLYGIDDIPEDMRVTGVYSSGHQDWCC